jgi:ADP-ribose pyrophosphatase
MISRRWRRYAALRRQWPELFNNPQPAPYEIVTKRSEIRKAQANEGSRLAKKDLPRRWRRVGVVHENPYLIIVRDPVRFPTGKLGTYIRVIPASGSAGAAVLPLLHEQVVLVRHFRHATRLESLEIPRGFGEPGVSPISQALKELHEEIEGEEVGKPVSLGELHSNNGIATDCVELFIVEISKFGRPQISEGITGIETYHPTEVADLIRAGKITDSFTIATFTRAWLAGGLPGLPPSS